MSMLDFLGELGDYLGQYHQNPEACPVDRKISLLPSAIFIGEDKRLRQVSFCGLNTDLAVFW